MDEQDTKTANGTKVKKKKKKNQTTCATKARYEIRGSKHVSIPCPMLQKLGMRSEVPNMLAFLVPLMAPSPNY